VRSHAVRFWEIRPNRTGRGTSYTVRWTVASREKSRTFARKALAERYRARLMQAADRGEAFDSDTGLPDSLAREVSLLTWFELACDFIDARWPKHAGKGRVSLAEGLTAVTPVLVKPLHGAPDPEALRRWAFNPPGATAPSHPRSRPRSAGWPRPPCRWLRWKNPSSWPVPWMPVAGN
jgi:hypothetical protein